MISSLAYLYGIPEATGDLRTKMSDFVVLEQLPFTPSGNGEHLLIKLRKTGLNTVFVARQLAKYFAVKESMVTYAGLKDRFAVTEQWFGVHIPGKAVDDLSEFKLEGIEVLEYARHEKKLRIGALTGNRFEIILRSVTNVDDLIRRWYAAVEHGVPNYYGEQRFGINGGNIEKAKALFSGAKVKDRKKRSIYLSAARSYLFNHLVSERIKAEQFDVLNVGDVMMLAGTQSIFHLDEVDDIAKQRFIEKDIDLTACLWGSGETKATGVTAKQEYGLIEEFPEICHGLIKFGLKQERRRIRLSLNEAEISFDKQNANEHVVKLKFFLPSGCFATTILREILNYQDLTEREFEHKIENKE
ncbi:tRNA pseudouridine(13) synthase TruD [Thalassotalea piscium]|uniref:tRNA pseudouridine synthase D n=1 Tax=Thalassotalea piscium TaxID=1230533 RepID=A0A7X0NJF9_9GAMM|nr:tRNA pseudouridine(13) synthase TruD [Thalassotalea piscium]MBB6544563.1 tRNA pseudouridine13 synthase [Thalassotalea piscium]